jgi:hypothetical protein
MKKIIGMWRPLRVLPIRLSCDRAFSVLLVRRIIVDLPRLRAGAFL